MRTSSRVAAAVAAAVLATALAVAGCGSTPATGQVGLFEAPANLDPASPLVRAQNVAFDRTAVNVPSLRPFVLILQNGDNLPHNISIYRDAAFKQRLTEGRVVEGTKTIWYPFGPLQPGTYFFQCDIHPVPSMQGTFKAL